MSDDLTLGQRIAVYRRLRGLTQVGLGQLLHRSTSWVTKVERGERRVDSMSVLLELSRALGVPIDQLSGRGHQHTTPKGPVGVDALRRVLDRAGGLGRASDEAPPSSTELASEAARLRLLYNHGRGFNVQVPILAALIDAGQRAAASGAEGRHRAASGALANLYRLGSLHLRQIGDLARARLAIDRALLFAENSDDDVLLGSISATMTVQLMIQGDPEDAVGLAFDATDHLDRIGHTDWPARLAVSGALHLYAAQAAARAGSAGEATSLLKTASSIADRLGRDDEHYCLIFGPTNVAIQSAGIMVDLERPDEAMRVAEPVRPHSLRSSNRAGYHYLHMARAHGMMRDQVAALEALIRAHQVAPNLVNHDPLARDLVRGMLRRRRHVVEPLRRLAHYMGIAD